MSTTYSKTALAYFGLKEAMLYFPHVIPLTELVDFLHSGIVKGRPKTDDEAVAFDEKIRAEFLRPALLPPELRTEEFLKDRQRLHNAFARFVTDSLQETVTFLHKQALDDAMRIIGNRYPMTRLLPTVIYPDAIVAGNQKQEEEDVSLVISSLKLVDVNKCEWYQLFEFRKDPEAMDKLRRLRLFAYENYTGRSRDFIEDKILVGLQDYETAVKEWGFATSSGAINTLLGSTLVAGGIAGSFLSAYLQAPLPAVVSMMGPAGIAIGGLAIGLGKQTFERRKIMATNPVSYISYAREKLGAK